MRRTFCSRYTVPSYGSKNHRCTVFCLTANIVCLHSPMSRDPRKQGKSDIKNREMRSYYINLPGRACNNATYYHVDPGTSYSVVPRGVADLYHCFSCFFFSFLSFFVFSLSCFFFPFLYLFSFLCFVFPIDLRLSCVCLAIGTTRNIYVVVFLGWQAV